VHADSGYPASPESSVNKSSTSKPATKTGAQNDRGKEASLPQGSETSVNVTPQTTSDLNLSSQWTGSTIEEVVVDAGNELFVLSTSYLVEEIKRLREEFKSKNNVIIAAVPYLQRQFNNQFEFQNFRRNRSSKFWVYGGN
jgi:hypothetical protein